MEGSNNEMFYRKKQKRKKGKKRGIQRYKKYDCFSVDRMA